MDDDILCRKQIHVQLLWCSFCHQGQSRVIFIIDLLPIITVIYSDETLV